MGDRAKRLATYDAAVPKGRESVAAAAATPLLPILTSGWTGSVAAPLFFTVSAMKVDFCIPASETLPCRRRRRGKWLVQHSSVLRNTANARRANGPEERARMKTAAQHGLAALQDGARLESTCDNRYVLCTNHVGDSHLNAEKTVGKHRNRQTCIWIPNGPASSLQPGPCIQGRGGLGGGCEGSYSAALGMAPRAHTLPSRLRAQSLD